MLLHGTHKFTKEMSTGLLRASCCTLSCLSYIDALTLFTLLTFIKHLLCAKYCIRHRGYNMVRNRTYFLPLWIWYYNKDRQGEKIPWCVMKRNWSGNTLQRLSGGIRQPVVNLLGRSWEWKDTGRDRGWKGTGRCEHLESIRCFSLWEPWVLA